ncbi:MAG: helix-turn-helix transcriptional regulator [Pseudonocardiales bacterium]|nr:helix-turn-helix transcriptional regulator [Pseudonocardiales bacterium]
MSTATKRAREALGARLREIRQDANLTGRALAHRCGWHFTKVSKVEHGTQNPSEDDLRAWCHACDSEDQVPDLIATVRAIESMYLEWRRALCSGMKHGQKVLIPLYERTRLFRVYEPGLVPGLFQTPEYASTIIAHAIEFNQIPNDLEEALAARMERQRVLHTGDRRFLVVLEEQALRTRVGETAGVMAGQLDRLLTAMSLHRLSLGIIPSMGLRHTWPSAGFWIFDQHTVHVETPSAELTINQRSEIVVFEKKFARHQQSAVYGQAAKDLINKALADLSSEPPDLS